MSFPMIASRMGFTVAVLLMTAQAGAQDGFPARPIHLVVGAAAGGSTDLVARVLGERMARSMGTTFVIENRPGGGGSIASEQVARAKPDGYTLLMGTVSTHGINPTLYKKLRYDAQKDFAPISQVVSYPMLIVVNAAVPVRNVRELVDLARQGPQPLMRASAGNGSSMHLAGELFDTMAGIKTHHVPYRGSAPAAIGIAAGETAVSFESISAALPHIRSGKLRPIAVTSAVRTPLMPEVPAAAESLPGYEMTGWTGLLAPAGTPHEIVERFYKETSAALSDPEVRKKLAENALQSAGTAPAAFALFIQSEIAKLGALVKSSGATID